MKKIKLNSFNGEKKDGYELDPTCKYVINVEEELDYHEAIIYSFMTLGTPPALKNYHSWLYKNGFNIESPNPTNNYVAQFYGVKPLWKTPYSQGIVVRAENEDDYFIVMECSDKNKGYKHTKVLLTPAGCL